MGSHDKASETGALLQIMKVYNRVNRFMREGQYEMALEVMRLKAPGPPLSLIRERRDWLWLLCNLCMCMLKIDEAEEIHKEYLEVCSSEADLELYDVKNLLCALRTRGLHY
eukprot:8658173-Karenia_brevis.AAC.1